jgi:proteasome lid subunit RPN8/RPN11
VDYRLDESNLGPLLARALKEARRHREIAGLLVDSGTSLWLVELRNTSRRRGTFVLHRGDWAAAERAAKRLGFTVAGTFHSHVVSEAVPSPGDIRGAIDGELMLILDTVARKVRLWRITRGKARPLFHDLSRSGDIVDALKRAAADDGSLSACFLLGRLYDEGWGVRRSPRAAARWYLRAGEGGLPEALYFVASAYEAGDGVARDQERAIAWYRKAAALGDRDAVFALAVARLEGHGLRKNEAAGVRLLTAAARHHGHAMQYLAAHHLKRNRFSLAKKWATRAVKAGVDSAPHWLRIIKTRMRAVRAVKPRRRSRSSSRTSPPRRGS